MRKEKRLTQSELRSHVDFGKTKVNIGGVYRHYKGGIYCVVDVVVIEESGELAVVYEALNNKGVRFVRPLQSWVEQVSVGGVDVTRFMLER